MDDKELDKRIQEQLGDYRETPDPRVWDRIRASLDTEKKTRRIIPLWLRWGAAAAILLAGLYWLAPREEFTPGTPAVTRSVPSQDAPEERGSDLTPPEPEFPATNQYESVAADATPEEQEGTTPPPNAVVKESDEGGKPSGKPSVEEPFPASRIASSDAAGKAGETGSKNQRTITDMPAEAGVAASLGKEDLPKDTRSEGLKDALQEPEEGLAETSREEKSLFEAVKDPEPIPGEASPGGKWTVGPSLAPVYFNSFGSGSPIASNFVNNSKSGTLNMSYGLQVSYQLSKKLSLRSGIHRVAYGYNTDDVSFRSSPAARPSSLIRTISYSENSKNLVVQSMAGGVQPPQESAATDVSAPDATREGQMLQEFGYLEVPLEMQYNLLDKKWGISLIGGLSSLFLVENTVSLQSGEAVTEVGEATNMNSLNFSTNVGLGFYYRLNPRFELNLQPMFKYQLNTFTQTAGSFRPYSIGIYSGLNFRF